MGKWILGILAVLVVVGAFFVLRADRQGEPTTESAAKTETEQKTGTSSARHAAPGMAGSRLAPDRYDQERATLEKRLSDKQRESLGRLVEALRKAQEMSREKVTTDSPTEPEKAEPPKRYATDRDGIQSAIQSKIPEIKECYESWLNLNPEIAGKIVANFVIGTPEDVEDETATITKVNVKEGGLGNTFLEGCILNGFSELSFELPPGGGQIEVNYPLVFRANDEPPPEDSSEH